MVMDFKLIVKFMVKVFFYRILMPYSAIKVFIFILTGNGPDF